MTKRALLFVNRHARQGKTSLAQAVEALHNLDFDLITISSKRSEELPDIIRQHRNDVEMVIIGGGDGTLNGIVDVLLETKLPLGILPLGTANDLARTLGLPQTIPEACQAIAADHLRYIDLGCVNGKHFFNVASLGLSVKITKRLSSGAKQRWGVLAYAFTAMQVFSQTRPFSAELRANGESISVRTLQIAIGNGRYYGGGMAVASDAAIDDQRLDLYSLEVKRWWQMIPLLLTMRRGEHATLPWVRSIQAQTIEVYTRRPYAINTDGELTTETPATFRVVPKALAVLAPEKA